MTLSSIRKEVKEGMAKNKAAQALGRLGGKKRKEKLPPERRREIAREAGIKSGYVRRNKAKKELDAKFKKE